MNARVSEKMSRAMRWRVVVRRRRMRDTEEVHHRRGGRQKPSQSSRWNQSRERRGCRGTMLLSAAEKKVHVQTERHDNVCPPALCFAPYYFFFYLSVIHCKDKAAT